LGANNGVGVGAWHGAVGAGVGVWRSAGVGAWHGPVVGAWHGAGVGAWRSAGVGAWHGGGWRWHSGFWRHGFWHNGWWGPAIVTGIAVGAIATYPYNYNDCWAYEPLYDAYGNYLGQQYTNICTP
jgi:hypothetical protein